MTWRWAGLAALLGLLSMPAEAADKKAPDGLVKHSRQMIALEEKIAAKLTADAAIWSSAMESFHKGVAEKLKAASTERHRLERASMAIKLRQPFASAEARQAVLLQLAQVDLAIDDLAKAQMAEVRRLDAQRAKTLVGLVALMKRIRGSQVELLAYLEDPSLGKKLGQIDVGSIATSVAEAKRIRASLDEAAPAVDFAAEKQRIEQKLNEARGFLAVLEAVKETTGAGGEQ